ncbi:Transcriptional activator NphR [compost metagenome]
MQGIAKGYILKFGNCFWDKTPISASNCKAVPFDSGQNSRKFDLDDVNKNDLRLLFDAALKDYQGPFYSNKADAIAAYLKIIIIKIANIHSLLQLDKELYETKLYQRFVLLVQQDFKKDHNVSNYSNKLRISSRKLNDVCKAAGTGAKEIITSEIISEAKRLLHFTSLSIKEISMTLGFSTPYHFSAFFKNNMGLSPANYKSGHAQKDI